MREKPPVGMFKAAAVVVLLVFCVGCESEQTKQAKVLLQQAVDKEMLSERDAAMNLYEEILKKFPETESAEVARAKITDYKAQRENAAGTLYAEAEAASEEEMEALCKIIIARYSETKAAKLAQDKLAAYEEIKRERNASALFQSAENSSGSKAISLYEEFLKIYPDLEEAKLVPDRIAAEQKAMRIAEEKRRKRVEEERQAELRRQQQEEKQRQAALLRQQQEAAERERARREEEQRFLRALREKDYRCECHCGQNILAMSRYVKRYNIRAESVSEARSLAYEYYDRKESVSLGNCPSCRCDLGEW